MIKPFDFGFLYRKKTYDETNVHETKLARVFGVFDVTCLAVSFTIVSAYVLFGDVIAFTTGPSLIVSFAISGFSTFLAALCYAELGSRVPRAGSAYTYIYVTIGELVAFVMGWDLILEYVIGAAGTSSALSLNIDYFFDNKLHTAFKQYFSFSIFGLPSTPDLLAFVINIIATLILLISLKESSWLTKILAVFNVSIIMLIIVVGSFKIDFSYWSISATPGNYSSSDSSNLTCTDPKRIGDGGFFPFGIGGAIAGSARCFVAYIGFDAICASGEEVKEPEKNIPKSIILTLIIVTGIYFAVAIVMTTMVPYCILDPNTPLPQMFALSGLSWMRYVVSTGATISLIASLNAGMYPMPRIVYAMACDGLIFKPFTKVLPKFKTPAVSILATGVFSSLLCLFLDLNELIDMMSIGTLLAYSIVCICVLVLRYRPMDSKPSEQTYFEYLTKDKSEHVLKKIFWKVSSECDRKSSFLVNVCTFVCVVAIIAFCALVKFYQPLNSPLAIVLLVVFGLIAAVGSVIIWIQPQNQHIKTFKSPLLPFWPLIAVLMNVYLIFNLTIYTWYRLLVWLVIGLSIYFMYGVRHSQENRSRTVPTQDANAVQADDASVHKF